jgi:hypothetical protein
MRSCVVAHIDEFGGTLDTLECCFHSGFGSTYKSDNCTIGICTWINIQKGDTLNLSYGGGDLINQGQIMTLTKIWYTFNDFLHLKNL